MIVYDYCSGTGSFSEAFLARGHTVYRYDNDERFSGVPRTFIWDIRALAYPRDADVVLGSPPCPAYSPAGHFHHFRIEHGFAVPRDEVGALAEEVTATVRILGEGARFLFIENPRGLMRKARSVAGLDRMTVWYCQYGDERAKPTDLFGRFPEGLPARTCHNGAKDHAPAPRGAKSGTQGRDGAIDRARIPYALSLEICLACEQELASPKPDPSGGTEEKRP